MAIEVVPRYPCVGETFELELDADAPENTPMGMIGASGHDQKHWKFTGTPLRGRLRRRFQLTMLDVWQQNLRIARNWYEVRNRAFETPSGQWIRALDSAFPGVCDGGLVGVADASWIKSGTLPYFPGMSPSGRLTFFYADSNIETNWRWLVAVPDDK